MTFAHAGTMAHVSTMMGCPYQVLEMWGYTCAAQKVGIHHDLHPELAAQVCYMTRQTMCTWHV